MFNRGIYILWSQVINVKFRLVFGTFMETCHENLFLLNWQISSIAFFKIWIGACFFLMAVDAELLDFSIQYSC